MIKLTSLAIALSVIGIYISVSILSAAQTFFAISAFYYLYIAYKENNLKLPKSSLWLLGFIAVAIISLLINIELVPKPGKNFGRLKYLGLGVLGIFVFKYWLLQASTKVKRILVSLFLFSITVAALYGLFRYFTLDEKRLRGFTDTLRYGYGMGMILLVILAGILHHKKSKDWFDLRFAIPAFLIGFLGLYFSYTRGAVLGFFCGLPFVCFFYSRKLGLTLGSLGVLVVLTLGGFYLFGSGNYGSRFLVNKNNNSDHIRKSQWQAAVIMVKEKPILGYGFSNYHSQLKRVKHQYDLDAKYYNDAHAHNIFLEVASGTGIIGLFFFIGWVVTWALETFKNGGLIRAFFFPFGVAWVISSQFEMTFDSNNATQTFLIYSLSSALGLIIKNENIDNNSVL